MKEYDHLLADDPRWAERAKAFVAKVRDVHELLAEHEPQAPRHPIPLKVAYHDACHLAHAQQVRAQPRELLRGIPELELVEPADWEMCCGSAGIYNLVKPEAAAKLGQRKAANLRATGAEAIAAANPGCAIQIARLPGAPDAHLPPDDPARHVDPRRTPMSTRSTPPRSRKSAPPTSSPTTRWTSWPSCTAASTRAGSSCCRRASERGAPVRASSRRRARSARATGACAEPPGDYQDRRVEITGPTDRKLVINALNSGAKGFMADFEDANSPTWANQVEGHVNLIDAIEGTITYDASEGKHYELDDEVATLLVRPRGWHLPEKHLRVDGDTLAGAFMDFGLYFFHNAQRLLDRGTGPYFYLPKMEHHLEARLWNDVFDFAEDAVGVPRGTIRATVLIETLPAAFQMDEILYELREHSLGLNAGRWDYIFSMIKCFRDDPTFVLPDRNDVKMTVPFMQRLHRAAGADVPQARRVRDGRHGGADPVAQGPGGERAALAAAKEDKEREAEAGFDGTWVAHPDVVEHGDGGVRRGARRQAQPDRQAAPRRLGDGRAAARRGVDARRDHRGGPAQRRLRRLPVHLVLARRPRARPASTT